MKWFKHDSDSSLDKKLQKVRLKYGMQGYGLYWYLLEMVAINVEKHNLSFELEHDAEIISFSTGISYELVQEMMSYMVSLGLFENQQGIITCLKMANRTDEYTQKLLRNSSVPTVSRQCPDKVPPNRREEKRIEETRIEEKRIEKTLVPSVRSKDDPEFAEIKKIYPKRAGGQPWAKARKAINARFREDPGLDWQLLIDGVTLYANYCEKTQQTGSQFVKQAASFFGPDKHFLELWTPPKNKAELLVDANIEASKRFLMETENG